MSKMNELSIAEQEEAYEQMIEYEREEFRKEGAEELRIEILRELEAVSKRAWTKEVQQGINTAIVIAEKAQR